MSSVSGRDSAAERLVQDFERRKEREMQTVEWKNPNLDCFAAPEKRKDAERQVSRVTKKRGKVAFRVKFSRNDLGSVEIKLLMCFYYFYFHGAVGNSIMKGDVQAKPQQKYG